MMYHSSEQMLTFARMLEIHMFHLHNNALHITLDTVSNKSSHLLYVKLLQRVMTSLTICASGFLSHTVTITLFSGWTTARIADKK